MIEIMVAMMLGLFVIGGIVQVLVSHRDSYRFAEALSRTQESGRFAAQTIARELRGTRSLGCRGFVGSGETVETLACSLRVGNCSSGGTALVETAPMGYEASQKAKSAWLKDVPAAAKGRVNEHWVRGDVLVVWGTVGLPAYMDTNASLTKDYSGPIDAIGGAAKGLKASGLAVITDCKRSDVFKITGATPDATPNVLQHEKGGTEGEGEDKKEVVASNASAALSQGYSYKSKTGVTIVDGSEMRAQIFPFDYRLYYVCCVDLKTGDLQKRDCCTGRCDVKSGPFRPSLCRWSTADNETQSLVSDIADMQMTYSGWRNTNGLRTRFLDLSASAVEDSGLWAKVDSVRVRVLSSSEDEVRSTAQMPPYFGAGSVAADRRIYKPFELTVATRSTSPWYVPTWMGLSK